MKSEPVSTESPISDSAGVVNNEVPDVSKMSNNSTLNSHLIQLLLYYRCLLRHSFRHCIPNESQMKLERTLFNNLEQHFQSLLISDGDSIRQFTSLPSNHIFLSSKGYISIQRLDQLFESFVNSTPTPRKTTNKSQTKQIENSSKLITARTSSAPAEIFDNESSVKDKNCQNYSKKHRASLDEQSLSSKKLKKSSSKRNSSSLSSSSESSSESDNTVVDQDFKVSTSKKRSKKLSDENGVEVDSTKDEVTSSNRDETLNGTPESSGGRPRRSCTLKSQPIYSSVPLSVLKKNAQTYSSTKKAKKIENVENRQSQSSSRASTSSSQNSQTVEELVVNCDPFNLIDSVGNSSAPHNGRIYITNSNSGSNVPQQQQQQQQQQTVRINLTGPKPIVPATRPIGASYMFKNRSSITAIPVSSSSLHSLPTSAAPSTSAPNFSRFNSKLPPTLSVVNNPMAGKSLGKILLINSKPFFIQNGNNISLPMINQNQTNVSAVVNQFTTAINAASTLSNNNKNSPKTFATIPAHSSKPIQAIVKPAAKPAVKIEIESDPEEDCKDNVRKEIERLKTGAANNNNNNNNNSSVPKQKLLKTAVQPPPPLQSGSLPLTVRFVNKPSNLNSYSNSPNLVQTNQSSSSSSDSLRRNKQISNSKEATTTSSGVGSSFILTSAKDQIEKSKQTRLNSMFEALAKAKAAKKTQELLSLQKSKEAAAIVTATISLCSPKSSTQASTSASASSSSSSAATTTSSTLAKSYPCNLKPYSERIAKKTELIDQLKLRSHRQTRDPVDRKLTVYRNNTTDAIIGYKCNYEDCAGFLTARRDKVLAHIRTRHGISSGGGSTGANSNSKSLVCDLCSKKFSKPEYLTLHRKIGHSALETSSATSTSTTATTSTSAISAQGPFRCTTPGCDKQFNYRKSLHNHIANHFYEKPFVCNHSYCTERFIYSFQLKEHQRTEHGLIADTNGGDGGDSQTKSSGQQSSNVGDSSTKSSKN